MGVNMKTIRNSFLALCSTVLLVACASDAWKSNSAENSFFNQLQKECYFQRIGPHSVGDMLENTGTGESDYFLDVTSRLYNGQITTQSWMESIASFLNGRESDPGVQCVLNHMPKR